MTARGLIFSLLLVLIISWIAFSSGFFRLPKPSSCVPLNFKQVFGSFLIYVIFALIVLPLGLLLTVFLVEGHVSSLKHLSSEWTSWTQAIALWVLAFFLCIYSLILPKQTSHFIFWGEDHPSYRRFWSAIGFGVLTCAISYPFVLLMSLVTKYIALHMWGNTEVDQVAVKQLEMAIGKPFLFTVLFLAVVFIVPFAEELLFRGFLQNFFKKHFGRKWGIFLSSIIFSCAHFAKSQGIGNFQLLLTLCVLAFFLGFIYEKKRTLWAPYSLHMTFNALNILMIVFSK